jgi:hypothetical protein
VRWLASTSWNTGISEQYFMNAEEVDDEDRKMFKMQPLSLMADGKDADGRCCYHVRFDVDGREIEYTFRIKETKSGLEVITGDKEFSASNRGDPKVTLLERSIGLFHNAREFEYSMEEAP